MKKKFYSLLVKKNNSNIYLSPLSVYKFFHAQTLCKELLYSGTEAGRYSFLPLDNHRELREENTEKNNFSNIKNLEKYFTEKQKEYDIDSFTLDIPYCGGLVSAFSYDYALQNNSQNNTAYFAFSDVFLVFDQHKKEILLCGWFDNEIFWKQYSQRIINQIQQLEKKLEKQDNNHYNHYNHNNQASLENITFKNSTFNYFHRTQCPIPLSVSGMDLVPSRRALHKLCNFIWS